MIRNFIGVVLAAALLVVAWPPSAATGAQSADTGDRWVTMRERCQDLEDGAFPINVLILADASKSLLTTDPTLKRVSGIVRAVSTLSEVSERYHDKADIEVAVDTFSVNYSQIEGWGSAPEINRDLRSDTSHASLATVESWTDYAAALRGATRRFLTATPSHCNLLIWFTDGAHDTIEAGITTEQERADILALCNSDPLTIRLANELQVATLAVRLSDGEAVADTASLSMLYGETGECEYPLVGSIQTYSEAADLSNQLDEIIAEAITSNVCLGLLPGEPTNCEATPPPEAATGCVYESTLKECIYEFTLTPDTESFRVYIDQTALHRGISSPEDIYFDVYAPSGSKSSNSIRHVDTVDEIGWQEITPFGFWTFQPYDSRWQMIGHQASLLPGETWEGAWRLHFWSDTQEGNLDAQKVAASVNTIQSREPSIVDLKVDSDGTLVGFFQEHINALEAIPYSGTEIYMAPVTDDDDLFYATLSGGRGYFETEPLELGEIDNQIRIENIGGSLLMLDDGYIMRSTTDAPECAVVGGGKIFDELSEGGGISAQMMLHRAFVYGPELNLLTWITPNSNINLTDAVLFVINEREELLIEITDKCVDREELKNQRQKIKDWLSDNPNITVLPENVAITVTETSFTRSSESTNTEIILPVDIELEGRLFGWTATIKGVEFQHATTATSDDIIIMYAEYPLSTEEANTTLIEDWECVFDGLERPVFESLEWMTSEPSPEPVFCDSIRLVANGAGKFTATIDVRVELDSAPIDALLNSIDWNLADSESKRLLEELFAEPTTSLSDKTPLIEAAIFEPPSKTGTLLSLWTALVAVMLMFRIWRATQLRKWKRLVLPDYIAVPLTDASEAEINTSFGLAACTTKADIGQARLRSSWLLPLIGGGRHIVAKAKGGCITRGTKIFKTNSTTAKIGKSLSDGWVAAKGLDGTWWIYMWDLPMEYALRDEAIQSRLTLIASTVYDMLHDISTPDESSDPTSSEDDLLEGYGSVEPTEEP